MKTNDLRTAFSDTVARWMSYGYTIFPDCLRGHQGELAKVDLRSGDHFIRILLYRDTITENHEWNDVVVLKVGAFEQDSVERILHNINYLDNQFIDETIWNEKLETIEETVWLDLDRHGRRDYNWFVPYDQSKEIRALKLKRSYRRSLPYRESVTCDERYKKAVFGWVKKQRGFKSCKADDIESVVRVNEGKRHYYIVSAKGKKLSTRHFNSL